MSTQIFKICKACNDPIKFGETWRMQSIFVFHEECFTEEEGNSNGEA